MTATIGPTPTLLPTVAPEQPPDTPADAAAMHDGASIADPAAGEHPLARLMLGDLHAFAQPFKPVPSGPHDEVPSLLAPFQAPPSPHQAGPQSGPGHATPLYDTQLPGGPGPQVAAPVKPGAPMELRQLEALNAVAQRFNINNAPNDPDLRRDLGQAKLHLKAATEALRAGDYAKAAGHMRALGLPAPMVHSGGGLSEAGAITAILLGAPVQSMKSGGWNLPPVGWEKDGLRPLIDLNGFAANAVMIDRLGALPGGVSNPPTEAQVTQYMHEFANPAKGPKPTPQQIMQAASEITNGMIIHYSSAGASNPTYGANPNPIAAYKAVDGKVYEFASFAQAEAARKAGNPAIASGEKIAIVNATSPDEWRDIAAPGKHAGRHIGDCESKVYLQTRLLTAAGLTSLGSVNVEHGSSGHMFGVFKSQDGKIWITSNEEFKQVQPAKADNGKVTQEHLDYTLLLMTAELYGVKPNIRGELDGIKIASAATAGIKGSSDPAVGSIRRSTEMSMTGRTEVLIPPPPPPAGKVKP